MIDSKNDSISVVQAWEALVSHGSTINRWNDLILSLLEVATNEPSLRMGPPMVARALAMIYSAAYQAWSPFSDNAKPYLPGGPSRRPQPQRTEQNKAVAVSYAIYRTSLDLFNHPVLISMLREQMIAIGLDPNDASTSGNVPSAVGNNAAAAVLASRQNDNSNQDGTMAGSSNPGQPYGDYTDYKAFNNAGLAFGATLRRHVKDVRRWQPLSYIDPLGGEVKTPGYIAPHWGNVTPFSLTTGSQFRPAPPAGWTPDAPSLALNQAFLDQARYVVEVQNELTLEQKIIAEFWADGPRSWLPPGHWCEIAGLVSKHYRYSIDDDAKLFFALTNAILDASIATWEAKRFYDYARPITAIRWLYAGFKINAWAGPGLGTNLIDGERWRPYQKDTFPTPPFPEYTSGHSAFSMAAAVVLAAYTKSDRFTLQHIQEVPLAAEPEIAGLPVTLTWNSFSEAAFSAGESRLFGGIHFFEGNVQGLELGRKVGLAAWAKAQTYFA
ncbi:vanadium-dependent haloperoxidase [Sphingomonas kaistensis]|uniref:Vanadium-dependent haloperoxidase n=1 Tax=Sphingomonas kaistensis TaxID=298708 RepID=A0ABZ2G5C9_9SPHN